MCGSPKSAGQRIGELLASGRYRIIQLRDSPSQIQRLTIGANGSLWFTETFTFDGSHNRVGKITYIVPLTNAAAAVRPHALLGGVGLNKAHT
jgi:hypothetical protein